MMRSFSSRFLRLFLCVILVLTLIKPSPVQATENDEKTVRVGWYISDLFQEGSDDEPKNGYAYDYLRKIADYASWEYEYVYGGWTELYNKLCSGEIDIMAGMSITEERESLMLFPDSAMGTDKYYLYKHANDFGITGSNLYSFNGKKVGLLDDNRMSDLTVSWLEENDISADVIYYDDFEELDAAFAQREIDIVPRTLDSTLSQEGITAVVELGEEPYYVAVSKQRPDLLEELDDAISDMNSVDPYLLQDLQYNNYSVAYAGKEISDEERTWLRQHPVIKVGYMDNYLPYSATGEDGQATGLVTDVVEAAFEALEIENIPKIEYVAYKGYQNLVDGLNSGEVDLAFPVDSELWRLEQDDISASSEVITDRGALFYRNVCEKDDVKRVAVNENNVLQIDYTRRVYPDAELLYYSSIKECLEAVLSGEADGTIMDTLRVQYVTGQVEYKSLSYVQLGEGTGKCFGVDHGNKELLKLINRGLKLIGSSYGYDSSYQYMNQFDPYTTRDFLEEHRTEIGLIIAFLVSLALCLLIMYIRKQKRELAIKEALKREAEEANAAKSNFLFNMSHDIRTPMNAVLGFNELMLRDIDKPDKLKEYIGKIKYSGEYLLSLINNVLEVARIDSGNDVVDEDFADLKNESYYVIFENEARKKQLNIIKNVDVEHRYVYADAQKIREILLNIVSNAIKYTPEGGTIRIELKELPCDTEGKATYTLSVSDNGIGMTEEFQKHIFDTFAREHNSTDSKVMGTGLGMAIVKKLTELMGGTISVQSELGKGSTFTVTMSLRIVENPEEFLSIRKKEEEAKSKVDFNLNGRKVLVAEDNELNAEITTAVLENFGAVTEVATDGVECVDMLQRHEAGYYAMILMDIQMPNLDGYGAARKIRKLSDREKAEIPIVAMTANAFDADKKKAFEAGMDAHIAKPISTAETARVLESVLARKGK